MVRHVLATGIRMKLMVLLLATLAFALPTLGATPSADAREAPEATASGDCSWYTGSHPTISRGDYNSEAVAHAQCLLNYWMGYGLAEDGDFGPLTEAAVIDFQTIWGFKDIDGIVGPCTWAALHPYDWPDPSCF